MPLLNGLGEGGGRGEDEQGRFDYGKVGPSEEGRGEGGLVGKRRHVGPARVVGKREGKPRGEMQCDEGAMFG